MVELSMPRYTDAQFEEATRGSGAIFTTISNRIGCDWHTAEKRIRGNKRLDRLFEDEASKVDDLAESVVIKAMQEGDVSAAKWWLERRRRGKYAVRVETEVTGKDGGPVATEIIIKYADDNDPPAASGATPDTQQREAV